MATRPVPDESSVCMVAVPLLLQALQEPWSEDAARKRRKYAILPKSLAATADQETSMQMGQSIIWPSLSILAQDSVVRLQQELQQMF